MKKNLFISWSGDLSRKIAKELKLFFEETLQHVEPFYSPDIPKGAQWLEKINAAIENSAVGILCLTKENHNKPWVLFEAGALSRVGVVCPIVFGLSKTDISGPISIFQASDFNKEEFQKLFEDINQSCGAGLTQKIIDRFFENEERFDKLNQKISEILESEDNCYSRTDANTELLREISNKLNLLTKLSDSKDINSIMYIDSLIDSILELFEKLNNDFIEENLHQFNNILNSIDYIITDYSRSNDMSNSIKKFEMFRKTLKHYS